MKSKQRQAMFAREAKQAKTATAWARDKTVERALAMVPGSELYAWMDNYTQPIVAVWEGGVAKLYAPDVMADAEPPAQEN